MPRKSDLELRGEMERKYETDRMRSTSFWPSRLQLFSLHLFHLNQQLWPVPKRKVDHGRIPVATFLIKLHIEIEY